jgi:ABC-type molybdate transport system substrate-binding protein
VATQISPGWSLTTTGVELTEGKHYWEVELKKSPTLIGISRPNLDPTGCYFRRWHTNGWFMDALNGALYGNGKAVDDQAGPYDEAGRAGGYKQGDRVGVLLDLDNGSLRFFKNGVQHGPGYAAGSVTGPVVAAMQMHQRDESVRLLPNAEAPAGV